jgi:hypothetical protein
LIAHCRGWFAPFSKGLFGSMAICNLSATARLLGQGIPLAFGSLLSNAEWAILTVRWSVYKDMLPLYFLSHLLFKYLLYSVNKISSSRHILVLQKLRLGPFWARYGRSFIQLRQGLEMLQKSVLHYT